MYESERKIREILERNYKSKRVTGDEVDLEIIKSGIRLSWKNQADEMMRLWDAQVKAVQSYNI
jgi:hypothetical protein